MDIVNERREKAEGVIMVAHLDVVRDFLRQFLLKELGQSKVIELSKGQAVHLDLEHKTYQILPK